MSFATGGRRQSLGPWHNQLWPWKPPFLQDFVIKAEPLAVKIQKLQTVAPPPAKREDCTSRRHLAQHILGKSSQPPVPLRMSVTPQAR